MTLKDLQTLEWKERCKNSSIARTHGPDYIPKEKFSDTSEKELKKCIRTHSLLTGCGFFWSTPNKSSIVGTKDKNKSNASMNEVLSGLAKESSKPVYGYSSGENGMSDMAGFFSIPYKDNFIPVCIALEIKIPGDRQQPDQKDFEAIVKTAHGWYIIVKDFESYIRHKDEIFEYYKNLFLTS